MQPRRPTAGGAEISTSHSVLVSYSLARRWGEDRYLALLHTKSLVGGRYATLAYTFAASPPFEVLSVSRPLPLLAGKAGSNRVPRSQPSQPDTSRSTRPRRWTVPPVRVCSPSWGPSLRVRSEPHCGWRRSAVEMQDECAPVPIRALGLPAGASSPARRRANLRIPLPEPRVKTLNVHPVLARY